MLRWITLVTLVLVPGCSKLLGFQEPVEATDGGGGGMDAPPGDFTIQPAHLASRVPAGSFDFVDVIVSRAGVAAPITLTATAPAGVTTMGATIASDATAGHVRLDGDAGLTIGSMVMVDISATDGVHTHDLMVMVKVTGIPGTLDVTFGGTNSGFLDVQLGSLAGQFHGILVDGSDEPIVFGDTDASIADQPNIAVLTADGTLKMQTTQNVCGGCSASGLFHTGAIGNTGRVFAVGAGHDKNVTNALSEPVVVAFDTNAVLDTGFGTMGIKFIDLGDGIEITSVAADGANVVVETTSHQMVRFANNGANDFGWNGGDPLDIGISASGPQAIAIDPLQHVYVAGTANGNLVVERLTESGAIDTGFTPTGIVDSGVAGSATAAIVQPDHAVVVGGVATDGSFVLFRVLQSGGLDPAFGTGGVSHPNLSLMGFAMTGMALQKDGKIVISSNGGVLVRFLASGDPDPTFGTNGVASIPAGVSPTIGGVALQSDGKIIVTGGNLDQTHSNGVNGNGMVARVWF